jgi:hypothetical protein
MIIVVEASTSVKYHVKALRVPQNHRVILEELSEIEDQLEAESASKVG